MNRQRGVFQRARSPGKLILSGEHSVLYGKPALAMAVNCYAESVIASHLSPAIFFNLRNLRYAKSVTLQTLKLLKNRLQEDYHAFLNGKQGIRDVLKKPFELLQFTVSNLIEKLNITLPHGVEIRASSNIPMGCGMGSSAATVMSTLHALAHFFRLEIEPVHYLSLGREAENLQHGRSSGLDLQLAMVGGCLKFQEGHIEKRDLPKIPMYRVQTGKPESTTGQCVTQVAHYFKTGTLLNDFEAVTEAMDKALQQNDLLMVQDCVRQNHCLLTEIGVVPSKVQQFIKQLEMQGAAAKICGAGAVVGDKGGVVLVVTNHEIEDVVKHYGYTVQKVEGDLRGTQVV